MGKTAQLEARLTRDGNRWKGTIKGDRSLHAAGHNTRYTRNLLLAQAKKKYGEDVEITFHVDIPDHLKDRVDAWVADNAALLEHHERNAIERAELAEALLLDHMTQGEAAAILGTSQNHLAMFLKRYKTGATMPISGSQPKRSS